MIQRIVTFTRERTGLAIAVYFLTAIAIVQVWSWAAEFAEAHKIIDKETVGEPFDEADRRSCSAPGFCFHTVIGSDGNGGLTTKQVYGFATACPGHKLGTSTYQRYRYYRQNGDVFERDKHLRFEPATECIT